jgi:hypothetical protein
MSKIAGGGIQTYGAKGTFSVYSNGDGEAKIFVHGAFDTLNDAEMVYNVAKGIANSLGYHTIYSDNMDFYRDVIFKDDPEDSTVWLEGMTNVDCSDIIALSAKIQAEVDSGLRPDNAKNDTEVPKQGFYFDTDTYEK